MTEIRITDEVIIYNDMPRGWINGKLQPRWHKKVYQMWYDMWSRCRNSNKNRYKYYKDCKLYEEFKYLSKYIEWLMNEPRFEEFTQTCDKIRWNIDKDMKDPNNRNYYPKCMTLTTVSENSIERNKRGGNITPVIATSGNKILLFKSICDARDKGFNRRHISSCINKKRKTHKGYKWYKVNYSCNKVYRLKEGDIIERTQ